MGWGLFSLLITYNERLSVFKRVRCSLTLAVRLFWIVPPKGSSPWEVNCGRKETMQVSFTNTPTTLIFNGTHSCFRAFGETVGSSAACSVCVCVQEHVSSSGLHAKENYHLFCGSFFIFIFLQENRQFRTKPEDGIWEVAALCPCSVPWADDSPWPCP